MKTRTFFLVTAALFLVASAAWAKGQPRPGAAKRADCRERAVETAHRLQPAFAMIDADHNGQLSRPELVDQAVKADCFRHLDRNRDGQLSAREIARLT